MKIGISGASGQLGRAVVAAVQERSSLHDLVAITRNPGVVASPIEARLGDYDKPETLASAYSGLDRLLLIPSPDLRPGLRTAQIVTAIDAAMMAGVGHIFLVSATGTRKRAEPAMGAAYWAGEQRLLANPDQTWTVLRTSYFAETFAEQAGMAASTGHVPGLAENRIAFVSRDDVAAAAAGALTSQGHEGAIYNLTGPDRVTGAVRTSLLSQFTGMDVRYAVMSETQLRDAMSSAGVPAFVIDVVATMQAAQAEGDYDIVTGDIEKLTGRAPRSLLDVLQSLDFSPQAGASVS